MNFIAIENSTNICSVGLFVNSRLVELLEEKTLEHSKCLPLFVEKILKENKVNIDYVALSIGPGSFTALKIGSSFAKGLAAALKVPIVPIETFDGMRYSIKSSDKYYIAIYSHKNYAFSCLYNNINSKIVYRCSEIDRLSNHAIFGYGFPEDFDISYKEIRPSAENIGLLSMEKKNCYKENSIDNINPIYLTVKK